MRKLRPKLDSQAMTEPGFEWKTYVFKFQISPPPQSSNHRRPASTAKNSRVCKMIYQGQHTCSTNWPNQLFSFIIFSDEEEPVVQYLNINPVITGQHGRLTHGKQGKYIPTHWVLSHPTQWQTAEIPLGKLPSTC